MLTDGSQINAILHTMYTTIIFDLYGVLLPDPYAIWLANNGIEKTHVYTELMNRRDNGEIDTSLFFSELSRLTTIPEESIRANFYQPVAVSNEMRELLKALSSRYKLGLLTNSSKRTHTVLEDIGLTSVFNEIVISADVGVVKPQPEIFEIMLQRIGSSANETIFIDDNNQNVASAATLGITATQFENPVALIEFLQNTLGYDATLDGIAASHL